MLIASLAACKGSDPSELPSSPSEPPTARPDQRDQRAPSPGKGLDDPANDPELVERAKAVIECPWSSGFGSACEPLGLFYEALKPLDESPTHAGGRALVLEQALVRFAADHDVRVRFLGASGLARRGNRYKTDVALAGALVRSLEDERDPTVGNQLGVVVARITLVDTGLAERVEANVTGHKLTRVRAALVGELLYHNGVRFFELTRRRVTEDPVTAMPTFL